MAFLDTDIDLTFKANVSRLRDGIQKASCIGALDVHNLDAFQVRLNQLLKRWSGKTINRLVVEILHPHLEHIRSFEVAISVSAQQCGYAAYIWSALLAIIECACRHVDAINRMVDQIQDFYKSFPNFQQYVDMFPQSPALRFQLQNMYTIYTDFSLHALRYMSRNPAIQIARHLFSSRFRRDLGTIQKRWIVSKQDFDATAELAFRDFVVVSTKAWQENSAKASALPPARPTQFSNLPRPHRYFVGREETLASLHNLLVPLKRKAGQGPRSCLLHAMGGMGKTQTAFAYGQHHARSYTYRFLVQADNPTKIVDSFKTIAGMLGLRVDKAGSTAISQVRRWLETTPDTWLLVFDNVEQEGISLVEQSLPGEALGVSAVILTSQLDHLKHHVDAKLALTSLDTETGAELLRKSLQCSEEKVPLSDTNLLEEVAEMLGGHPLALAHIGGYISATGRNLSSFRDFFTERWQRYAWHGESESSTQEYEKRLQIVWDLALNELPPNVRNFLNVMAYMNPDGVPEGWLVAEMGTTEDSKDFQNVELVEIGRSLHKRCLITLETTTTKDGGEQHVYLIHRSLQLGLRAKLDENPEEREIVFTKAMSIMHRISPKPNPLQIPTERFWPQFQIASPHVLTLCKAFNTAHPPIAGSLSLVELLYGAGFHIWETWNPRTHDGAYMLETAEKVLGTIDHSGGRLEADISCMLSFFDELVGPSRWPASLARRQEILQMRKALIPPEHLHETDGESDTKPGTDAESVHLYFNAANDLGLAYLQNNMFEEAAELFELCFKRYKKWGSPDQHPFEYGKYYHNLPFVRAFQGRHDEAISLIEQGARIKLKSDGETARYVWYQYDVACLMVQGGRLDDALQLHSSVLERREKLCGSAAEVTLQSLYTVGAMHYHLSNLEEAIKYFRECLARACKTRWHDYALGRTQCHLARALRQKWDGAPPVGKDPGGSGEETRKYKDLIEAVGLEQTSREILRRLFPADVARPDYLVDVTDELTLFDSKQPGFDGRWTGRELLPAIQRARAKASEAGELEAPQVGGTSGIVGLRAVGSL